MKEDFIEELLNFNVSDFTEVFLINWHLKN